MTIRVLLADDQALLRSAFRSAGRLEPDMEVVGEASDGAEAARLAAEKRADVVLMDIRMPGTDGPRRHPHDQRRSVPRPCPRGHTDHLRGRRLRGAVVARGRPGFLGKGSEPEELLSAIRVAAGGEALLSLTATRG